MARISSKLKYANDTLGATKSPVTDTISKWKIPHYYKRKHNSGQTSTKPQKAPGSTISPKINTINSSKKVIIEDSSDKTSRSKKKNSKSEKRNSREMVFVNYTVQDKSLPESPSNNNVSCAPEEKNHKLRSKRDMLKMFRSAKDNCAPQLSPSSSVGASIVGIPQYNALNNQVSTPMESNEDSQFGGPLSLEKINDKFDYDDFMKYGIMTNSISESELLLEYTPSNGKPRYEEEVVPISKRNSSLAKPLRQIANHPYASSSPSLPTISTLPLISGKNGKAQLSQSEQNFDLNISPSISNAGSNVGSIPMSNSRTNSNRKDYSSKIIPQYIGLNTNNYDCTDGYSSSQQATAGNSQPSASPTSDSTAPVKMGEENDASIEFSKMFIRKRADTVGSIYSGRSASTSTPLNNVSNCISKTTTQRVASIGSLSSLTNRYSPIRTASPARPRSATRTSSVYRLSRDLTSLYSVPDEEEAVENADNETFLDSQYPSKYYTNNYNNPTTLRFGHKKKQESISDLYRHSRTTSAVSVTTPSSSSFMTSPYLNSTFAVAASGSVASTPTTYDKYGATNENTNSVLTNAYASSRASSNMNRKSEIDSNNAMIEFAELRSSLEHLPVIKGIGKKKHDNRKDTIYDSNNNDNIQIKQEKSFATSGTDAHTIDMGNTTSHTINNHVNDDLLRIFTRDSSENGSVMDCLMGNSLSTIASSTQGHNFPSNEEYSLINTGAGLVDVNLNRFTNSPMVQSKVISSNPGINIPNGDELMTQSASGFSFEGSTSFAESQNKTAERENSKSASGLSNKEGAFEVPSYHQASTINPLEKASSPSTVAPMTNNGHALDFDSVLGPDLQDISQISSAQSNNDHSGPSFGYSNVHANFDVSNMDIDNLTKLFYSSK
ncbi:hypothetical protein KAFR_0B02520 [Kazachstania africana CBS 2517]|uniref:Uncharacterized protein n=1 Tax=Kazachstania africana (strain ATCC 22294 / BCRC 22015 / CBS 2517 / CECT 1963 / NBRC 1671 / NRRL Y-8276) TaxID=1071382 RepID=H2AQA0_KAZAF|nr:hypothetical protein KAFR_0B02520 [Kazachstania africana CBS 2517]CCF56550.1 hypothetical protein KAFR_0B02520 [Kazachstania africana CBS 2517]